MDSRPLTLHHHAVQSLANRGDLAITLPRLIDTIGVASKIIAHEVSRAGLGKLMGFAGKRNVQGEEVFHLDEFTNDTLVNVLSRSGLVCAIGSEELAVPIRLPAGNGSAEFAVLFDPLDGSSNIDVAVPIGTIFGIYRRRSKRTGLGGPEDLLQPAGALLAAGYALYGSSTMLVYCAGAGVHGFTLDPSIGEFLLSHPDIRIPAKGKILSVNTANRQGWSAADQRAVAAFEIAGDGVAPHSLRYVGSLVADAHRTLLKGGIFLYPADQKNKDGKLRLLYEAGPLALLFEQAGGVATDGQRRILERVPHKLHDRTPLVLGGKGDVKRFEQEHQSSSNKS